MGVPLLKMNLQILSSLADIERRFGVRILLAVESGSRAWGFASADSDFDVRFIYTHPHEWYLSVFEQRDVIEVMGPDLLDASGWELRKALRLFAKCNLPLNEWFNSPLVYRENPDFQRLMQSLMADFFNPIAAVHHYLSMARTAYEAADPDGSIRIKKLFYALRALLACRWIELKRSQPPTEFASLVEIVSTPEEQQWIAELLVKKSSALEADRVVLDLRRRTEIEREMNTMTEYASRASRPQKGSTELLDSVLRQWHGMG